MEERRRSKRKLLQNRLDESEFNSKRMLSNFDDDDDDNGSLQTCKIGWEEFVVPNE